MFCILEHHRIGKHHRSVSWNMIMMNPMPLEEQLLMVNSQLNVRKLYFGFTTLTNIIIWFIPNPVEIFPGSCLFYPLKLTYIVRLLALKHDQPGYLADHYFNGFNIIFNVLTMFSFTIITRSIVKSNLSIWMATCLFYTTQLPSDVFLTAAASPRATMHRPCPARRWWPSAGTPRLRPP